MEEKVKYVLNKKFGYKTFRPGQKESIHSALKKEDTLVMLPTGTGKSLCYQLPAYLEEGLTLIVSPLLSLMQDQVESLNLRGEKRVAALNSMTTWIERERILRQIKSYRFIYTSPEMLQNKNIMNVLKNIKINLFVVDEAHCISHWGTDFRPDYLYLTNIRQQLNNPTTMALTATATSQVRNEILHFLGLNKKETRQIIQSVDRKEIKFIVENCQKETKDEKIISYLNKINGPGIIYFMSKKLADYWSKKLQKEYNIKAVSYHADIDTDDKIKIQQQFLYNKIQIICATSAFGMGFNKSDIRLVIHYHIPASPEMYLQEVGRISRDGELGLAVLLYETGDENIQKYFINQSLPTRQDLQDIIKNKNQRISNDDSILKLSQYYIDASNELDEAYQLIINRKEIKENQLQYMIQYALGSSCKRNFLLNYFNEENMRANEKCCSSCGLEMERIFQELNELSEKSMPNNINNEILSWTEILKILYNQ